MTEGPDGGRCARKDGAIRRNDEALVALATSGPQEREIELPRLMLVDDI